MPAGDRAPAAAVERAEEAGRRRAEDQRGAGAHRVGVGDVDQHDAGVQRRQRGGGDEAGATVGGVLGAVVVERRRAEHQPRLPRAQLVGQPRQLARGAAQLGIDRGLGDDAELGARGGEVAGDERRVALAVGRHRRILDRRRGRRLIGRRAHDGRRGRASGGRWRRLRWLRRRGREPGDQPREHRRDPKNRCHVAILSLTPGRCMISG
jgi:hypothetical protein